MKLTDAFRLSRKKFSTRRGRSIFAAFTSSLGILLILVMLMASDGVLNFVSNNFKDSLKDQPLILESRTFCMTEMERGQGECLGRFSLDELQEDYPDFNFSSTEYFPYVGGQHFGISSKNDLELEAVDRSPNSLLASNEFFVRDFLYGDHTFTDDYDGKIPVVISKTYITAGEFDNGNLSQEEDFSLTKEALEKYLGQTATLTSLAMNMGRPFGETETNRELIEYPEIELVIVGFASGTFFADPLASAMASSIIVPLWALESNPELSSLFAEPTGEYTIIAFDSVSERQRFWDEYSASRVERILNARPEELISLIGSYWPIRSRFFVIEEFLNVVQVGGLAVGGILLAISSLFTLTTIGKLVDDSKKEIGVFCAFGALKSDIRKIYYGYALILINLGLLIGFVLALIINVILSAAFGDDLFYSLINLGNNFEIGVPSLMFVSFPVVPLLVLVIVINLLGILAAVLPVRKATKIDPIIVMRDE